MSSTTISFSFFFFQAEDGIRDKLVTGVQTCALPISEYEKLTGIKVGYEAVSVGGMLTRLTTMAETKSGPEIVHTGINWPHLFDQSLVDVSDLAGEVGRKLGGWHEQVQEVVVINKKWKALPWGNIGQLEVYRTDWFKEV